MLIIKKVLQEINPPHHLKPVHYGTPHKCDFSIDVFPRRGDLCLFHLNIFVSSSLRLLESLLERGLLGIDIVAAEVLHPSVVAHQFLLSSISSRVVETLELICWLRYRYACAYVVGLQQILNATPTKGLAMNESHGVTARADVHSDPIVGSDSIMPLIVSQVLSLRKTFSKVRMVYATGVNLLSGLCGCVRRDIRSPALNTIKRIEFEGGIVLLEESNI